MFPCRGFTLIEAVATAAVILILGGIALPAASGALEAARSTDARAALLASLSTATTKAILAGAHTVICSSRDGQACSDSPDWTPGWIVFLDRNRDRDRNPGERIVFRRDALAGHVHLRSTVGRTRIVFQGNGSNAGSNVTFTLCDGRGPSRAVSLIVSNQGRLRQAPASASATAAACTG